MKDKKDRVLDNEVLYELPIKPIVCLISVFCITVITFFIWHWHSTEVSSKLDNWGQFGDFFGGILNPIIGFAGILLLAFTLKQNQIALNITAQELQDSRKQLAMSADALQKQEHHMSIESSERTVLYICNQIENIYKIKFEIDEFEDMTSLQGLAKRLKVELRIDGPFPLKNMFLFKSFEQRFDNSLFLLVMLARSTYNKDEKIKDHLYMIVACKLDMDFVGLAYTIVEKHTSSGTYVYTPLELGHVRSMIERISDFARFELTEQEVFKKFSKLSS